MYVSRRYNINDTYLQRESGMLPLEDSVNFELTTLSREYALREFHTKYEAYYIYLNVTKVVNLDDSIPIFDSVLVEQV